MRRIAPATKIEQLRDSVARVGVLCELGHEITRQIPQVVSNR